MKPHIYGHVWAAVAFATVSFIGGSTASDLAAEPQRGQQRQRETMRFRGMDTDRNGVITRAEWRGNTRSFRNHDWNNDGILSADEIRLGAPRNRRGPDPDDTGYDNWTADGFRTVDCDGDRRITRDEWRFDPELFARADRNGDNVLTEAEFLGDVTIDRDPEDRRGCRPAA